MTWVDYTVIVVLIVSIAWGAWRGLVHEVLSLAGWILAFLAGNLFATRLAAILPAAMRPELRIVIAFALVFVGTLVVAGATTGFSLSWLVILAYLPAAWLLLRLPETKGRDLAGLDHPPGQSGAVVAGDRGA